MNVKKILGFALWLLAFAIPFQFALLNTEEVVTADGHADNIKGLASFVGMMVLVFAGYMLVDSASAPKQTGGGHGH